MQFQAVAILPHSAVYQNNVTKHVSVSGEASDWPEFVRKTRNAIVEAYNIKFSDIAVHQMNFEFRV